MNIGFIGLGIMGSRMAGHLQSAGHILTVHNRTKSKAQSLIGAGATWADKPRTAVASAGVVITMLAHPDAVEQAALGDDGFLPAMNQGALWIDCSTVNPSFSRRMADAARAHSVRFMDAPVAGSKNQATAAELIFIVGGEVDDLAVAEPLFTVMGSRYVHVGDIGMGTSMKVVVNMLLATSMAAFAEGLVLGEKLGLSREMMLNVLIGGPVVAPFVGGKRDKIESDDYDPEFPLRWMQKDLHMVTQAAYEVETPLPTANIAKEIYQLAIKQGLGDEDFSAIYRFFKGE